MIPVYQSNTDPKTGDCLAACVASVLELDLAEVPNFCGLHGDQWLAELASWLVRTRRMWALNLIAPPDQEHPFIAMLDTFKPYVIAGGETARSDATGALHACVYRGGLLMHDPYPGGKGLTKVTDWTVILPLDPVR